MRETPSSCLGNQNFSTQPGSERKRRVNRIVWWVLIRNIYHPGLRVPWSGSVFNNRWSLKMAGGCSPPSHRVNWIDISFSVLLICTLEESFPHENPELDLGLVRDLGLSWGWGLPFGSGFWLPSILGNGAAKAVLSIQAKHLCFFSPLWICLLGVAKFLSLWYCPSLSYKEGASNLLSYLEFNIHRV